MGGGGDELGGETKNNKTRKNNKNKRKIKSLYGLYFDSFISLFTCVTRAIGKPENKICTLLEIRLTISVIVSVVTGSLEESYQGQDT